MKTRSVSGSKIMHSNKCDPILNVKPTSIFGKYDVLAARCREFANPSHREPKEKEAHFLSTKAKVDVHDFSVMDFKEESMLARPLDIAHKSIGTGIKKLCWHDV